MRRPRRLALGIVLAVAACACVAAAAGAAAVQPSPRAQAAAGYAQQELGVPYLWGGMTPAGFDASGLVTWSFAQVGISLPHYSGSLFRTGVRVRRNTLQPGDLVFFYSAEHVGIYVGGGRFIHAPHTDDVVRIARLSDPSYRNAFTGAVRIG